jgi:hypothetical protein
MERVFQDPKESLGRLFQERFAVSFPGMTQNEAENMDLPPLPLHLKPPALPEVDLGLGTGAHLHAPKGQWRIRTKSPDITLDRTVGTGKSVIGHQILVDPLSAQVLVDLFSDESVEGDTVALSASFLIVRNGRR